MVISVCGSAALGVVVWSLIGILVVWCLIQWADTAWLYSQSKSRVKLCQSESDYWKNECDRIVAQRDEYRAENDRLKKAAQKLVMQVAQDFGKETTKPKQG